MMGTYPTLVLVAKEPSKYVGNPSLQHYTYNRPLLGTHGNFTKVKHRQ